MLFLIIFILSLFPFPVLYFIFFFYSNFLLTMSLYPLNIPSLPAKRLSVFRLSRLQSIKGIPHYQKFSRHKIYLHRIFFSKINQHATFCSRTSKLLQKEIKQSRIKVKSHFISSFDFYSFFFSLENVDSGVIIVNIIF